VITLDWKLEPDVALLMAREVQTAQRAASTAMTRASTGLKEDWRAQIRAAGLGRRLANAVRGVSYPRGRASLGAAGLVYATPASLSAQAAGRTQGSAPAILSAFDRGASIDSDDGFWLAIPTPAAGRGVRGRRMTPGAWERRHGLRLSMVPATADGPALLVARARVDSRGRAVRSRSKTGRGVQSVVVFILVPRVRLPRRLDLDRDARAWQGRVPGLLADAWLEARVGR
jgi:hypothetical protein